MNEPCCSRLATGSKSLLALGFDSHTPHDSLAVYLGRKLRVGRLSPQTLSRNSIATSTPQVVKRGTNEMVGHSAILGRRTSDDSRTLHSLGFAESLPCVERRLVRHAANSLHDDRRLDVSHRKGVEFSYRQKKVEVK